MNDIFRRLPLHPTPTFAERQIALHAVSFSLAGARRYDNRNDREIRAIGSEFPHYEDDRYRVSRRGSYSFTKAMSSEPADAAMKYQGISRRPQSSRP